MTMTNRGVVIDGLDVIDITRFIDSRKKRFIAITMKDIEDIMGEEEYFPLVRKIILDQFNEYTRGLVRALIGDIEK